MFCMDIYAYLICARIHMGIIHSYFRTAHVPGERNKGGRYEEVQTLTASVKCNFF